MNNSSDFQKISNASRVKILDVTIFSLHCVTWEWISKYRRTLWRQYPLPKRPTKKTESVKCQEFETCGWQVFWDFIYLLHLDSTLYHRNAFDKISKKVLKIWPKTRKHTYYKKVSLFLKTLINFVGLSCLVAIEYPESHLSATPINLCCEFFCRDPLPFGGRSFSTITTDRYSEPCSTWWYLSWSKKFEIGWASELVLTCAFVHYSEGKERWPFKIIEFFLDEWGIYRFCEICRKIL